MESGIIYIGDGKIFDVEVQYFSYGRFFKLEIIMILDVVIRKVVGWFVGFDENVELVVDVLWYLFE